MMESEKNFMIVYEMQNNLVSLEYLFKNQQVFAPNDREILYELIIYLLIEFVIKLEKLKICIPILNPSKILISRDIFINTLNENCPDFFLRQEVLNSKELNAKQPNKNKVDLLKKFYFPKSRASSSTNVTDINMDLYH